MCRSPMFKSLLSLAMLALLLLPQRATASGPAADLIIVNARVWTVDEAQPTAEALAVCRDRIVAVGDLQHVDPWKGTDTRIIDAGGRTVLPGFNDSHVHFLWGGQQLDNVHLKDAPTQQEFAARIARHAQKLPVGEWLTGGSWDDQAWPEAALPTRQLIDPSTADVPVFVVRYDGHMGLANTRALQLAGITVDTLDPPGGLIVRDAQGEPTGILKDAAMPLVQRKIPPQSAEQRTRLARRAMQHAASLGVTSVQHMNCTGEEFATYAALVESGKLIMRVYAAPSETKWQDYAKVGVRRAFGSAFLRLGR